VSNAIKNLNEGERVNQECLRGEWLMHVCGDGPPKNGILKCIDSTHRV
jgi:hypothetical protein